jgi:phosphatidylinositol 4-kinase
MLLTRLTFQVAIAALVTTAWAEAPSLAVQMAFRFPSLSIQNQVRSLLVTHPEKALHEPDALQIMLGTSMPHDVSSQLKVSLKVMVYDPF